MTAGRWVFTFDASGCSGCKTCQVACKDRSGLEAGMLWRRVYEIGGGDWQKQGAAWTTDAFAYNLSIGCNHCERPVCVEVCPTGAMQQDDDGIVRVSADRCLGCRYCAWACPYGAVQYDQRERVVGKCDFCYEYLSQGQPPVCVASCPLRVLDVVERDQLNVEMSMIDAQVYPLPDAGLTAPALQILPPQSVLDGRAAKKGRLANLEEVGVPHGSEHSLAWFTVLLPAAAGLLVGLIPDLPARLSLTAAVKPNPGAGGIFLAAGLLGGFGLLASLTHLGRPERAWRALANWRASPLSREVWAVCAFVLLALLSAGRTWSAEGLLHRAEAVLWIGAVGMCGAAALALIGRVYRLRTVPAWTRQRPDLTIWQAALATGGLGAATLKVWLSGGIDPATLGLASIGILGVMWILLWERSASRRDVPGMRLHPQPGAARLILRRRQLAVTLNAAALIAALLAVVIGASQQPAAASLMGAAWALTMAGELQRRLAFYMLR